MRACVLWCSPKSSQIVTDLCNMLDCNYEPDAAGEQQECILMNRWCHHALFYSEQSDESCQQWWEVCCACGRARTCVRVCASACVPQGGEVVDSELWDHKMTGEKWNRTCVGRRIQTKWADTNLWWHTAASRPTGQWQCTQGGCYYSYYSCPDGPNHQNQSEGKNMLTVYCHTLLRSQSWFQQLTDPFGFVRGSQPSVFCFSLNEFQAVPSEYALTWLSLGNMRLRIMWTNRNFVLMVLEAEQCRERCFHSPFVCDANALKGMKRKWLSGDKYFIFIPLFYPLIQLFLRNCGKDQASIATEG